MSRWLDDALWDARFGARLFRRTPGFTVVAITTLAMGIGINVAMAGAVDRLLLRGPTGVRDPERLVRLLIAGRDPAGREQVSPRAHHPALLDFQRHVPALRGVAGFSLADLSFGDGTDAVMVQASLVSGNYFALMGIAPAMGRLLGVADDAAPGAEPVVVLSHGFWQRHFGGDSTVRGTRHRIGSHTYTIVGVAPAGYEGIAQERADVWLPLTLAAERDLGVPISLQDRGSAWLSLVGRLAPGATPRLVEQQATQVWRAHQSSWSADRDARRIVAASVILGRGADRPREVRLAFWLAAVSGLVLLLACANVAGLLLARGISREREFASRIALGADRGRLARQLLAEGVVLAVPSGLAALAVAWIGSTLLGRTLLPGVAQDSWLDGRLVVLHSAVALCAGLIVSVAPLARETAGRHATTLREGAMATSRGANRARLGLLMVQASVSMVLLVLAGVFADSLRRLHALDLGMDLDRTLLVRLDLERAGLSSVENREVFAALRERVLGVQGVRHVAVSAQDPFGAGRAVPAHTREQSEESLWHHDHVTNVPKEVLVDSGFFRAMGTRSLRGRDFTSADQRGAPKVAIINAPLARLMWPRGEALGECLLLEFHGGECFTVVGVVDGFLRRTILDRDELVVYRPIAQAATYVRPGSLIVSATESSPGMVSRIRDAVQGYRPDLPAVRVIPMRQLLAPQLRPWQAAASLFGAFAIVALLIACAGVYGVIAFAVEQRRREIAIRRALGAGTGHVVRVVAGSAIGAVTLGLLAGVTVAGGMRRWLEPILFETAAFDPLIIARVSLVLLGAALLGSARPAARALRESPAAMLRLE